MSKHIILLNILLLNTILIVCGQSKNPARGGNNKIIVTGIVPADYKNDSIEFISSETSSDTPEPEDYTQSVKVTNGKFKLILQSKVPVYIHNRNIFKPLFGKLLVFGDPGDSIHIDLRNDIPVFSGVGSEKWRLIHRCNKSDVSIPTTPKDDFLKYYYDWVGYVRQCNSRRSELLKEFEPRLSKHDFTVARTIIYHEKDDDIATKLLLIEYKRKLLKLSAADLCKIYDSTIKTLPSIGIRGNNALYGPKSWVKDFAKLSFDRNLDFKNDSFLNAMYYRNWWVRLYYYVKAEYKENERDFLLEHILTSYMIRHLGVDSVVLTCANDFLHSKAGVEYQESVREYLKKAYALNEGQKAPDLSLYDKNDNRVSLSDYKGKVVLMDFWFTGCVGCLQMAPALKSVETAFHDNDKVAFLSVNIDNNKATWLKSVDQGKYTSGLATNLNTGNDDNVQAITRSYNIDALPRLFLIDPSGNIIVNPPPEPRRDSGNKLIALINNELAAMRDGPYVSYDKDLIMSKSILSADSGKVLVKDSIAAKNKEDLVLTVGTDDLKKTFEVRLQKNLQPEPAVFEAPEKVFVVSDIEGNFQAFRKLLVSNGVIDNNFNWTFRKGHLVLAGDFFDRGNQVTEVLWLIYSLEDKAKASGGYVHFILGNHEIINLSGDYRYVNEKYAKSTELLKQGNQSLYDENTELGRWLRTKNIMEKIGQVLYVHGGVSTDLSDLNLPINDINSLSRPFYANMSKSFTDQKLKVIFDGEQSPFWYRGYYKTDVSNTQIENTLKHFNVLRIVTGHTIVSDTVSLWFNNRVINIDTHHSEGKSEALLIEGNKYYRVNAMGKKQLVIDESNYISLNK